jgi:formylglycine-generating enzyme required for sulfatase activity
MIVAAPAELRGKFGRYQIWNKIGAGGLGTVYLAVDTALGRRVALKVPHLNEDDPHAVQRFQREARLAAGIAHPNICPVFEVGEIDGVHYFTMPYIEGESLGAQIDRDHPWPPGRAAALVCKLARALGEIHRRGILHRALKPPNILMRGGEPVLLDFGLTGANRARILTEGRAADSPAYLSPEQLEADSSRIGPASDVYSLGVLLYQLATGQTPCAEDRPLVVSGRIVQGPTLPPSSLHPELDEAFDALCLKALARVPEDRFPSMDDFADALERYQAEAPDSLSLPLEEEITAQQPSELPTHCPRGPLGITAGVLVCILLGAAVTSFVALMTQGSATGNQPAQSGVQDPSLRSPAPPVKSPVAPEARNSFYNGLGMRMVWVQPGKFRMGAADPRQDGPPHEVEITRAFAVASHEVTLGQFAAFVADTGHVTDAEKDGNAWGFDSKTGRYVRGRQYSWGYVGWSQTESHPVVNVSWNDAMSFCAWLRRKENAVYDLPTEAEWEYVCRAGASGRYHCGDDAESLVHVGNVADASYHRRFPRGTTVRGDDGHVFTAPVGQFAPNAWGLYDMHGNVWEWCKDGRRTYQDQAIKDPSGPAAGARVLRGGSWFDGPGKCCCTSRSARTTTGHNLHIGFRVVLRPGHAPP